MDLLKNISKGRNVQTSMGLRPEFNVKHKFKRHTSIKEETTKRIELGPLLQA
jgi:hypothetical protein